MAEMVITDNTTSTIESNTDDVLVLSEDPLHPANLICELCRGFYTLGWVTGTGGGISIKQNDHIFIAPSGVQKERLQPLDIFILSHSSREYLRRPTLPLKPSACTPLFLAAYDQRGAGACIHTHSQAAVLVTLIAEQRGQKEFRIRNSEMIKGIPRGTKGGYLGYFDEMVVPIIENTAKEEDLRDSLAKAIEDYPESNAVLVSRHGVYVWGKDTFSAKTACECYDYLFQLAVEMHKLGMDPNGAIANNAKG